MIVLLILFIGQLCYRHQLLKNPRQLTTIRMEELTAITKRHTARVDILGTALHLGLPMRLDLLRPAPPMMFYIIETICKKSSSDSPALSTQSHLSFLLKNALPFSHSYLRTNTPVFTFEHVYRIQKV